MGGLFVNNLTLKKQKGRREMARKIWNKCNICGVITDTDEKCCPACGSNPTTQIKLNKNEVRELVKTKKVYTKHISKIERWLSQTKRPT